MKTKSFEHHFQKRLLDLAKQKNKSEYENLIDNFDIKDYPTNWDKLRIFYDRKFVDEFPDDIKKHYLHLYYQLDYLSIQNVFSTYVSIIDIPIKYTAVGVPHLKQPNDIDQCVYLIEDFYIGRTGGMKHQFPGSLKKRIAAHINECFYPVPHNKAKTEKMLEYLKNDRVLSVRILSLNANDEEKLIKASELPLTNIEFNKNKIN